MTSLETLCTIVSIIALAIITALLMVVTFRIWSASRQHVKEEHADTVNHFEGYFDKFGNPVNDDDVIWDGSNLYRVYWNPNHPQIEGFSITAGYIHNLTPEDIAKFMRLSTFHEADKEAWLALRDKTLAVSAK